MNHLKPPQPVPTVENSIERINSEKIRQVIDSLDFDVLETIFKEIKDKSGGVSTIGRSMFVSKFIGKDDIRSALTGEEATSIAPTVLAITKQRLVNRPEQEFTTVEPFIEFNPLANVFTQQDSSSKDQYPMFTYVLKALVHEEVHATQFQGNVDISRENGIHKYTGIVGVAESVSSYNLEGDNIDMATEPEVNVLLNEGLVEKIADYVTEEYLRRTGETRLLNSFFRAYPAGRMLVELLIHKIATDTGVAKDAIFGALVRASYEGVSLLNSDLTSQFSEDVRLFLEAYKRVSYQDEDYDQKQSQICQEFIETISLEDLLDPSIKALLGEQKMLSESGKRFRDQSSSLLI